MEKKEEAINTARGHRRENTVWTDGSRFEDKRVGEAFVWEPASTSSWYTAKAKKRAISRFQTVKMKAVWSSISKAWIFA